VKQLEFARKLRQEQTDAENLLWSHLRAYRLSRLKFRRQQPVGAYVVDFFCPDKKLIVELDGGQHQERVGHDEVRDAWLKSEGYTVLRYWNNEVMANLEGVLEDIGRVAGVFAVISPSPHPLSPQGRGV
jgi:very-short-patch-repair endonuclease